MTIFNNNISLYLDNGEKFKTFVFFPWKKKSSQFLERRSEILEKNPLDFLSEDAKPPQNVQTFYVWKRNVHLWKIGSEKEKKSWKKIFKISQSNQEEILWRKMPQWRRSFWDSTKFWLKTPLSSMSVFERFHELKLLLLEGLKNVVFFQ